LKTDPQPFLNPDPDYTALETAAAVILPIPYEGGVSYGTGAAAAPAAVIAASHQLEFYDEVLKAEPFRMGIATVIPPRCRRRCTGRPKNCSIGGSSWC
jgi:agmatinase